MEFLSGKLGGHDLHHYVDEYGPIAAFLYVAASKDIAFAQSSGQWARWTGVQKVQALVDMWGGRTLGINIFPSVANYQTQWNINQALNPWSEFFGALWILSELGVLIPKKWGNTSLKIAIASAIGGIVDPADGQGSSFGTAYNSRDANVTPAAISFHSQVGIPA